MLEEVRWLKEACYLNLAMCQLKLGGLETEAIENCTAGSSAFMMTCCTPLTAASSGLRSCVLV